MRISPETKARARYWSKRLECPVDENAEYHNTYWCNRDLIPIPDDRRTWTWQGYFGYWVICGVNTTAWSVAASLHSLGLSVPQAMGVITGVAIISGMIAVLAGWPGSHQYIGFTVLSRGSWGMRGGFWPVLNRIVTAIVWNGIQLYWGGQSVKIMLGGIIGAPWVNLRNTLPASANVDTASLISFFVFLVIFLPILMIPPEKLQWPLRVTFVMMLSTMFGMLAWSISAAGSVGHLMHMPATAKGSKLSWAAVYSLQSIIGAQASGALGQSDWTRYAKTPNAALFSQLIAAPILIISTAVCGLLITSATNEMYGVATWNPFELLLLIQQRSLSPAARAGTFFAGLGFFLDQLALCVILNCVSAGMDIAALAPKWMNIRRGGYLMSVISVAIVPWNYVTKPTTFITVLSGWSVFLSPMTGIVIGDYFLVRGRDYHLGDLYCGNRSSAYWYAAGFNWRGIIAWCIGIAPTLPGFVRAVKETRDDTIAWDHVYDMTYFYGFFSACAVHAGLHWLFPAPRQTGHSDFVLREHADMVRGGECSASAEVESQEVHAEKAFDG
ncbi:uncharacterized protein MYCFIDRAFT_58476 [Pseudocercospora fijiensis CIRAD86]|uniref:Uncharacterized protein n=1 Tax=Pseudocercospora fijiensis (strain CIRAD86) TaxID=383855 RepID=M3ALQ1_PSEFD|nr:uncharacterized protein MYCFIDRAFT_58476 [Pseudocercospora fijiensis CIRAD86]EME78382.1 hypothetical protein MYCFIDRAFT_58476 [Pseudocercospora fijiensis CIRAD86]